MRLERPSLPDAELLLYHDFIAADEQQLLLAQLSDEVDWRQDRIRLFGRECLIPRLQQFQGEPELSYRYSGLLLTASPWHPRVADLRRRLAQLEPTPFNCVLLNLYRDGDDSMGWHSDDEPELGTDPVIASLSLGAARDFVLRHRQDPTQAKLTLRLEPGSLLLMRGPTQHHWQHALPRRRRVSAPRINLTFRRILR
ncbi:alkylated DNA repair protein [Marinobacterium nitratireducens]|uniref:Alkylated DNA repair protein n=1 Tax=Marinobacterium nitratireducens TaxID=518897 RepID=A0A918DUY0_9GAMM|nr:alpha-ketoglutarate-dependent dioxygenase AlkB [Marinobacterium nitratireducens]GGO83024.1 alkylated DNA repair protein [Marinobacterium nitratireducens]